MQPTSRRNAPPPLSVDDFLRLILRSGIMDRTQLQETLRSLPLAERTKAQSVADFLVKQGKLSRFQAGKLLRGSYRGLVLGSFQVLAPIGRGGMGSVYLARDQRSGQLLALKVLPADRTEERIKARFRREMEMSQRVSHSHVAWTFDLGVSHNVYYMAMEYIPGQSMHRLVTEHGPLVPARAARLLTEVASALDHIHSQGLVHRDIKPANIMVTPHDHAKLLDLGLALIRGEEGGAREVIGGQGYVVGTMDYIAPEQTDDPIKVDGRSDIYSLGCTMYFALTGQAPFPGGTNREKMQRQREEQPVPILQLNPNVPPGLVEVVNQLMAKARTARFQTASEVEQALKRWQSGDQVLPLDRPEDLAFLEAVAQLETTETEEAEDIGLLITDEKSVSESVIQKEVEQIVLATEPDDTWWPGLWLVAGGLVVGLIISVILIVMLRH